MQQLLNSFGCGGEQAGSKEAGVRWSIQWGWQILRRPEVNALLLCRQCPVHLHLKYRLVGSITCLRCLLVHCACQDREMQG